MAGRAMTRKNKSHHKPSFGNLELSRRQVLKTMTTAVGVAALGCGSDVVNDPPLSGSGGSGSSSAGSGSSSSSAGQGGGGQGGGGAGGAGGSSPGCGDNTSLSPQELLAPIDTIVVLMMENRSFDHYLGGSLGLLEMRADIEGLSGIEMNPKSGGGNATVFHMMNMTPDSPPHSWDPVHAQWNMGANDGFVIEHAGASEDEVMGYYDRNQVPIHHALADAHTVCNHYYCSVLGPTWPNRFHLHGATSNGNKTNAPAFGFNPIWGPLKSAGLSVKNYHHGVAWATGGYFKLDDLASFDAFKQDAMSGNLPNFCIIDPQYLGAGANDDHPSNGDIPLAQLLISDVYSTLASSPQWSSCLLVVTYDEHGGFYDHVPPPPTTDDDAEFAQLGFRVPALVAGPYVRKGCAVNTVFDHPSVLATLTARWGIAPLNSRHAAANDLSSCIDPAYVTGADPQPPVMLPQLSMSMSALRDPKRIRANQHPELIDSLRQQGIYRTIMRRHDPEAMLKRHLDDCVRRGLIRLTS
jgi:phospholipase C